MIQARWEGEMRFPREKRLEKVSPGKVDSFVEGGAEANDTSEIA